MLLFLKYLINNPSFVLNPIQEHTRTHRAPLRRKVLRAWHWRPAEDNRCLCLILEEFEETANLPAWWCGGRRGSLSGNVDIQSTQLSNKASVKKIYRLISLTWFLFHQFILSLFFHLHRVMLFLSILSENREEEKIIFSHKAWLLSNMLGINPNYHMWTAVKEMWGEKMINQ